MFFCKSSVDDIWLLYVGYQCGCKYEPSDLSSFLKKQAGQNMKMKQAGQINPFFSALFLLLRNYKQF